MLKDIFMDFLRNSISNLPIEEQLDALSNIRHNWSREYESEILKNKRFCYECQKYSDSDKFIPFSKIELTEDCDSGGFMQFEAKVHYLRCPKCDGLNRITYEILKFL